MNTTLPMEILARIENAKASPLIPTSLEQIKKMDKLDVDLLMAFNDGFYYAALPLLNDMVMKMVKAMKDDEEFGACLADVHNIYDLLATNFFGDTPEEIRDEFASTLRHVLL